MANLSCNSLSCLFNSLSLSIISLFLLSSSLFLLTNNSTWSTSRSNFSQCLAICFFNSSISCQRDFSKFHCPFNFFTVENSRVYPTHLVFHRNRLRILLLQLIQLFGQFHVLLSQAILVIENCFVQRLHFR